MVGNRRSANIIKHYRSSARALAASSPRLYDFDKSSVEELPDSMGSDDVPAVREKLKTLFIIMSAHCPALEKQKETVLTFVHGLVVFDDDILEHDIFDAVRKY